MFGQSSASRAFAMTLKSPHDLLIQELKELQSAEQQIARAVPRLSKAISSDRLGVMLEARREEGGQVIERIKDALEQLDATKAPQKNVAIQALLDDAHERAHQIADAALRDAALLAAFQKIELYCLAAWGVAGALARLIQQPKLATALEQACEHGTDYARALSTLAESEVNVALLAAAAPARDGADGEQPTRIAPGE